MKNRVVFFGSIGIAKRILHEIVLKRDVDLLGVCCEPVINAWRDEESVYQYAVEHGIRILDLDEISELGPDLGISVRFNRIIRENVIDSFRLGIVNTHGGILPEYRGSYCNINALINGEKEYGVTLHYIASGVDDGDVIDIASVKIVEDSTGMDLYKESERLCYELVERNFERLLDGSNKRISQQSMIEAGHQCGVYKRNSTIELKNLSEVEMTEPRFMRTVRAFDSPHHEPAYIYINGKKVYMRVRFGDANDTNS